MLRLEHSLPTGINIRIDSLADWAIYNDIFVSTEYDIAIRRALNGCNGCCRVLDLGANVGLFAKRLLHIRRSEFPDTRLELVCIEGMPSTHRLLIKYFPKLDSKESARLLHGLAGERSGSAKIKPNAFHAMTSLAKGGNQGVDVGFLDLDQITKEWDKIDLIKCDIEGAEELVLKNYFEMLKRTENLIIEFHLFLLEKDACEISLLKSGLRENAVIHANQHIRVALYTRF
jgi:FkbM family methyltransferase